jgi:site-specific DNA-cytosine methylase
LDLGWLGLTDNLNGEKMPKAYYNENNAFAAAWLRELIKAKLIADGDVDDRSIKEIQPTDLQNYAQCHFFAGIGVWSYSLRNAGFPDSRKVWTGSYPCQPFSAAGKKAGFEDERHLWPDWFRLIRECRPDTIFGEQVASKAIGPWFDRVSDDLEEMEYTVGAAITAACGFGAPQPRKRLYFVGHSECSGLSRSVHNTGISSCPQQTQSQRSDDISRAWWQLATSPTSIPYFNGSPLWLARDIIKGYGNALCAPQAQAFIESYLEVEADATKQ